MKGAEVGRQSAFIAASTKTFGRYFANESKYPRIGRDMSTSKIPMTLREYLSAVSLSTVIFAALLLAGTYFIFLFHPLLSFLLFSLDFLAVILYITIVLEIPKIIGKRRAREINARLPITIAFIATLASADISIEEIISELGNAREFGEISREARGISVSSRIFGKDIITAMRESSKFSPSKSLSEFLQGIITTVTTGGDLKQYLTTKSREYFGEQENLIKKNSESVGIMSESYITVGVAFPLILMIILGVVGALSPVSPYSVILFIYLIALVMIPAIAAFFSYILRSTLREVEP